MRDSLPALVLALTLLISCSKTSVPLKSHSLESLESAKLEVDDLDFKILSARSRVKYQDQATDFRATANIRMRKDSLIWFSLSSSIGIEAVRVIITQDSILIMDRLKKTYFGYNFESLSEEFNFPIQFDLVQALILGKMIYPRTEEDKFDRQKGHIVVKQQKEQISIDNFIDKKTFRLDQVEFAQNAKSNTMSLGYANFKMIDDYVFPFASRVQVSYADQGNILNTQIEINYNKVEFDGKPLRFPFSIPSKYKPK